MKTIEQLKAEHAAQLAALESEHATAQALPLPPDRVMKTKPAHWVTYKRETLRAAFEVFCFYQSAGMVRPMEYRKNGCSVISPLAIMAPRYKEGQTDGAEYGLELSVTTIENYAPRVELIFYAEIEAGRYVRISASVEKQSPFDGLHKTRPEKIETRGYRERLESVKYSPNRVLHGYADKSLKYSSGGGGQIETSSDMRYLFINDAEHIAGQMSNLIAEIEG